MPNGRQIRVKRAILLIVAGLIVLFLLSITVLVPRVLALNTSSVRAVIYEATFVE